MEHIELRIASEYYRKRHPLTNEELSVASIDIKFSYEHSFAYSLIRPEEFLNRVGDTIKGLFTKERFLTLAASWEAIDETRI